MLCNEGCKLLPQTWRDALCLKVEDLRVGKLDVLQQNKQGAKAPW